MKDEENVTTPALKEAARGYLRALESGTQLESQRAKDRLAEVAILWAQAEAITEADKENAISKEQVQDMISEGVSKVNPDDLETDNEGQVIVNTGIYRWKDGSYHDTTES